MSDDFHRPTLTFPADIYNATQVRLYGVEQPKLLSYQNQPATWTDPENKVTYNLSTNPDDEIDKKTEKIILMGREGGKSDDEIIDELIKDALKKFPPPINPPSPLPKRIPVSYTTILSIDTKRFGTVTVSTTTDFFDRDHPISCGIIVGYAYEGHCYDLPKPKIMIIPSMSREIPPDDCGYDAKKDSRYKLWIVDKLAECVEFDMNQGFVEQLVLEANLPGKRNPTMYAARGVLGHRSGRLTE